jgi:hypothetical protein
VAFLAGEYAKDLENIKDSKEQDAIELLKTKNDDEIVIYFYKESLKKNNSTEEKKSFDILDIFLKIRYNTYLSLLHLKFNELLFFYNL